MAIRDGVVVRNVIRDIVAVGSGVLVRDVMAVGVGGVIVCDGVVGGFRCGRGGRRRGVIDAVQGINDLLGLFGGENSAPLLANDQLRAFLASNEHIFGVGRTVSMALDGRRRGGRRVGGAILQGSGHGCSHVLCSGYGVLLAVLDALNVAVKGFFCLRLCVKGHIHALDGIKHFPFKLVELFFVARHPVCGGLCSFVLLGGDVGQGVCQLGHSVLVAAVDGLDHACSQTCGLLAAVLHIGHQGLVVVLGDAQILIRCAFQGLNVCGIGVPVVELGIQRGLRGCDAGVQVVFGLGGRFIK